MEPDRPQTTDVPVLTLTGLLAPLPVSAWALVCTAAVEQYVGVPHPYYHAEFLAFLQMFYTLTLFVPTGVVL
ncbi:MAG: hypothetical protein GXP62_13065, partial [Oligoflexia bacterium]|nr:hypothetical protein [Oligoflexia bacterium]